MSEDKITMTDDEFREWHYKLWDWLAKTGCEDKGGFSKFQELDNQRLELSSSVFEAWYMACFACGAGYKDDGTDPCDNCPIDWGNNESCACSRVGSLFRAWDDSTTKKDRKYYAKLISQLPWRGKEREV